MSRKPVALIILDGWGIREMREGNAVLLADTPNYERWLAEYERAVLDASGEAVGLPAGQMGNSEVGHLNLGAGRVVYQDITRIDKAIEDHAFGKIKVLAEGFRQVQEGDGKLHLIGLLGPGGVHSHQRHLHALLEIAKAYGVDPVIHVITDGRDTPTRSGINFLANLEEEMALTGGGTIASVSGRYYAMDRDNRWERTEKAYRAIARHEAEAAFESAAEAIRASYAENVTDEFIIPRIVETERVVKVEPGDVLLFYNFRADRMRQIVKTFAFEDFDGFERAYIEDLTILTMTDYEPDFPVNVVFPDQEIINVLAEVLSKAGKTQLHSAETEKYPHVTYFFNGGKEVEYEGESRILVASPKVATYDLQPEMSAYEVTEKVLAHIDEHKPDFILINYANPDMVGHTGVLEAAVKAVEAVDECAAQLVQKILDLGGVALVTADHGNCERMIELTTGKEHTYHTTNPVSFFIIADEYVLPRPRGVLADVAPTVLELLGLEQPKEMTGKSLVESWKVEEG